MRKRTIRKWGNSFVIVLTSSDIKDLSIKAFDEVDIEDIKIIKKNHGKGKTQ